MARARTDGSSTVDGRVILSARVGPQPGARSSGAEAPAPRANERRWLRSFSCCGSWASGALVSRSSHPSSSRLPRRPSRIPRRPPRLRAPTARSCWIHPRTTRASVRAAVARSSSATSKAGRPTSRRPRSRSSRPSASASTTRSAGRTSGAAGSSLRSSQGSQPIAAVMSPLRRCRPHRSSPRAGSTSRPQSARSGRPGTTGAGTRLRRSAAGRQPRSTRRQAPLRHRQTRSSRSIAKAWLPPSGRSRRCRAGPSSWQRGAV